MITFVIATLNRPTLERAVRSLLEQEDPDWRAIVVGDGVVPSAPEDRRIRVFAVERLGHPSHVRNRGVDRVRTRSTAFLDDDDRLTPDYVTCWRKQCTGADVLVFRMRHPQLGELPQDDCVRHGNVGISFAVRTRLLHSTPFRADYLYSNEDFELLHDLEERGALIRFSPDCCYLVRDA